MSGAGNDDQDDKRLRVGVAGLGVVGGGAALRLIAEKDRFEYCGAIVNDASKPREEGLSIAPIVDKPDDFFALSPDVLLDATPNGPAGRPLIERALREGVHVISANKQALAGHLKELHTLARAHDATLAYAASVGGGAPMVETVRLARESGEVEAITAIVNGTVNFILTQIERGGGFEDAVKAAQEAGFAEPDPTADLSGEDAKAKISILAFEAIGREPAADAFDVEALSPEKAADIAAAGGAWRQVTRLDIAAGGESRAVVKFERVDGDAFLSSVVEEGNAVRVILRDGGGESAMGPGAGRAPTVGSLFADLYALYDTRRAGQ